MVQLTKDFKADEFRCKCKDCKANPDSPFTKAAIVKALQKIRDRLGYALTVTRGVSCEKHNRSIGGAPKSRHLPQYADGVDVFIRDSAAAFELVDAVIKCGDFKVIRVYPHHVHIDMRPGTFKFLASPEN